MTLDELIPKDCSLILDVNGQKKEFFFGKFTLEKAKRLNDIFGGNLQQALTVGKSEDLAIVGWNLMTVDSKKELLSYKFYDVDDSGNEIEISTTGPSKLLSIMHTVNDLVELLNVIGTCIGVSTNKPEEKKDRPTGKSQ
jgi:hypothetical protein